MMVCWYTSDKTRETVKMKTIWKFLLRINDRQVVVLPHGAQMLTIQMQGHHPCLWALVDPSRPPQQRGIQMYGTGHPATDAGVYIATFQTGPLVFHVFEDREEVLAS